MFNINRPRRICFNEWMNLAKQLSGQTDVSKDDMLHRMEQVVLSKDPMRLSAADKYASDECASGAYNPKDETDC